MVTANDRQVGGDHYKKNAVVCPHCGGVLQHWDVYKFFPYLIGTITKYLWRWQDKNGLQDLEKAGHYLAKQIEVVSTPQGHRGKSTAAFRRTDRPMVHEDFGP